MSITQRNDHAASGPGDFLPGWAHRSIGMHGRTLAAVLSVHPVGLDRATAPAADTNRMIRDARAICEAFGCTRTVVTAGALAAAWPLGETAALLLDMAQRLVVREVSRHGDFLVIVTEEARFDEPFDTWLARVAKRRDDELSRNRRAVIHDAAERVRLSFATPGLVGREVEIEHLVGSIRSALEGRSARSILLSGAAGVGKTAIVASAARQVRDGGAAILWVAEGSGRPDLDGRCRTVDDLRSVTLELFAIAATLQEGTPQLDSFDYVTRLIDEQSARTLSNILLLDGGQPRPDDAQCSQSTVTALAKLVWRISRAKSLLIVLDDVGVASPIVHALHAALVAAPCGPGLAVVSTGRSPEALRVPRPPIGPAAMCSIDVAPLPDPLLIELLRHRTDQPDREGHIHRAASLACGNVRLAFELLEAGATTRPLRAIERELGRVPQAKAVLLALCTFEGTFTTARAAHLLSAAEAAVAPILREFVLHGLLRQISKSTTGDAARDETAFAFANSLVVERGRELLAQATLERLRAIAADDASADAEPEDWEESRVLATQLQAAHRTHAAIDAWLRCGRLAMAERRRTEAATAFTAAVTLVRRMEAAEPRLELRARLAETNHRALSHGVGDRSVLSGFARCARLSRLLGAAAQRERCEALAGLAEGLRQRGNLKRSAEIVQELRSACDPDAPDQVAAWHWTSGLQAFHRGFLSDTSAALRHVLEITPRRSEAAWNGSDVPAVPLRRRCMAAAQLGVVQALAGDGDASTANISQALRDAEMLAEPNTMATTLGLAALHALWRDEPGRCNMLALTARSIATGHELCAVAACADFMLGWSRRTISPRESLTRVQNALGCYRSHWSRLTLPLGHYVESLLLAQLGRNEDALMAIDEALRVARQIGQRVYLPELMRQRLTVEEALGTRPASEVTAGLERWARLATGMGTLLLADRIATALKHRKRQ